MPRHSCDKWHAPLTTELFRVKIPAMENGHTLGHLLELLEELERLAFEFYRELRLRHLDNHELAVVLSDIMADELHHARVVREIADSLSQGRKQAPVPEETIRGVAETLAYIRTRNATLFDSTDDVCEAIEKIETFEFGVVLSFVDISEIKYEFTRVYLQDQSVDHTNKIYRLQQCFD